MDPIEEQRREQLAAAAGQLQSLARDRMVRFRRALVIKGVLLAILGLCALFWPGASMAMLVRLVGIFCVFDGVSSLVVGARYEADSSYKVEAGISLLLGAILLFWPGAAGIVLMLFGAWALYTGLRNILYSRQLDAADPDKASIRTIGMVISIVGVVLLFWPGVGVATISWIIGIAALLIAAVLLFIASRLKQMKLRVETSVQ
jgi:uncharacterized membrane protein HdeD (DUF308 family)